MMVTPAVLSTIIFLGLLQPFGANAASSFTEWPPQYCHTNLNDFSIPKLKGNTKDLRLLQVQAVIRHGARTPAHDNCWDGYDTSWDCAVSQLESTFSKTAS